MSAPSQAFSSQGTRFAAQTDTPPLAAARVYAVPPIEVASVSLAGVSAAEIDVTSLASQWKSFVLGTLDIGTLEVSGFVANGQTIPTPRSGASEPVALMLIFGKPSPVYLGDENGILRIDMWAHLQSVSVDAAVDEAVGITLTYRLTHGISVYYRHANGRDWVRAVEVGKSFDALMPE